MKSKFSGAVMAAFTVLAFGLLALAPAAVATDAQTTLYTFTGDADGHYPFGNLISDSAGKFYGTTQHGGSAHGYSGNGTVFELSPNGSGGYNLTVLHTFNGGDGKIPYGGLALDSQGNLYGTCLIGGTYGAGTVFQLSPSGSGWNFNTIHYFTGGSDGYNPTGSLVVDAAGNVYGTTEGDGDSTQGTVYELSPAGSGWNFQVVHTFNWSDGAVPMGGLTLNRGNLYGATSQGGGYGSGIVFKLKPVNGSWIESILYTFTGASHYDSAPIGTLAFDSAGRIVGTTAGDAVFGNGPGVGGVFRLVPSPSIPSSVNQPWTLTWLYKFTGGNDGGMPYTGVIFDTAGNIYSSTFQGGSSNHGVVYRLNASTWTQDILWTFSGGADGCAPINSSGGLLMDNTGTIYGAADQCGSGASGAIFKLTPQ